MEQKNVIEAINLYINSDEDFGVSKFILEQFLVQVKELERRVK
ncbi:hypothetical protein ACNQFZ_11385 [Schinkia sp. CFF1]